MLLGGVATLRAYPTDSLEHSGRFILSLLGLFTGILLARERGRTANSVAFEPESNRRQPKPKARGEPKQTSEHMSPTPLRAELQQWSIYAGLNLVGRELSPGFEDTQDGCDVRWWIHLHLVLTLHAASLHVCTHLPLQRPSTRPHASSRGLSAWLRGLS